MIRVFPLLLLGAVLGWPQDVQDVVKHGEEVFGKSCATGYCHGAKGTPAGAPRLAGRGFDQAYIANTAMRGIPGTAMPAFATTLSRADLAAVVAYVATLNGIANPSVGPGAGAAPAGPPEPQLTPEAAQGRDLFYDAVRGFSRCSTCHEVRGVGMPVTTAITNVPADVPALRALASPHVATATVDGESMPCLIVSQAKTRALFYDLTSVPPVLRTVDPASLKVSQGSAWRHASVIGSYSDSELAAILTFLREVVKP